MKAWLADKEELQVGDYLIQPINPDSSSVMYCNLGDHPEGYVRIKDIRRRVEHHEGCEPLVITQVAFDLPPSHTYESGDIYEQLDWASHKRAREDWRWGHAAIRLELDEELPPVDWLRDFLDINSYGFTNHYWNRVAA